MSKVVKPKNTSQNISKSFDRLAKRLDDTIQNVESDLNESIALLENDIAKLVRKQPNNQHIKKEIDDLSKLLEYRVQKSVSQLLLSSKTKANRSELKFINHITNELVRLLSFDFYRNVLIRLNSTRDKEEVDEFGMDPQFVEKIAPLVNFLYYKYWRVETTGIDNIPNKGRALIVGNHSGTLPYDGAMLAAAIYNEHPTRNDARFLVENFVYHMPIMGSFMYRIGGVRACPENAERLLEKDHMVIVFPEGVKGIGKKFSQRYQLQRFGRGGFIRLVLKTKSPLIPVGIIGAEEIHPIIHKSNILAKTIGVPYIPITPTFPMMGLLGAIPFPTKWRIHFGKPMHFYKGTKNKDSMTIHKHSEEVRHEIQSIIYDQLQKRDSIWY